jgi:hypothetical protein
MEMGMIIHYGKFGGRVLSIELTHEETNLFAEGEVALLLPSREKLWELQ